MRGRFSDWRLSQPGFDPSYGKLVCLATLMSSNRTKQICLWMTIYIIYPKENVKDRKTYIGISSTKWKYRYVNHKFSFSHEQLKHQTALSKHFWSLKNKGLTPEIQWSILKKSNTPKCFDSRCNLCLEEKI